MSFFKELQELEDQGIDLIEVLGQDKHLQSPATLQHIISRLARTGENLYSELLYYLTYRRFTPEQAESLWRAIMKHKARLSEALKRGVTFRVAALDYLSSRNVLLRQVRLIAKPEFESILSYVNIDEVTAVYSRRYFNEILGQEVHRARRYRSPLSLLVMDIDDFKRINDVYGHVEGDAVLRRVGRLLRDSTRQSDSVCRFGGDEFAVLLPETNGGEAFLLADRVRKSPARLEIGPNTGQKGHAGGKLRRQLEALGVEGAAGASPPGPSEPAPALTLSIGGATFPSDCDEAEELVALADQMCLDAKRSGKDCVRMSEGHRGLPLSTE